MRKRFTETKNKKIVINVFPLLMLWRLFNCGTFRCGIYKRAAFISKIKIEDNEIMC